MPSEDPRFSDAEGDIIQHTVNNEDWDVEYLFIDRLKLLEDDTVFIKFIESVVSPGFRIDEDDIVHYVLGINDVLQRDKLQLAVSDYDRENLPVYTVREYDESEQYPIDLKRNTIPIYVDKSPKGRIDRYQNHKKPEVFNSIVLVFNEGWNDYGVRSQFAMFFYDWTGNPSLVGYVKIIIKNNNNIDSIPESFVQLNDDYCSLGMSLGYYQNLSNLLGKEFLGLLFALRDAAFFTETHEKFEKDDNFNNSLLRFDEQERTLREAKHLVAGLSLDNLYSFQYKFIPKYSREAINVDFQFGEDSEIPNRVYALIGKNGAGKTQLITSLPINIAERRDDCFDPTIPLFSRVIAVSYSIFDTFQIPKKMATFNYVYCGLRNEKGTMLTDQGLLLRFHNSWKKIEEIERINKWRRVLLNFIEEEVVSEFLIEREDITSRHNKYKVSLEGFGKARKKLSSGESIILYIITQIVANIRYDSLLLFDEPETHLHPNAITQLMNTIYSLVNEFQSYCILATHSPLVIRECLSRNVYIMERHENTPAIRKIGLESFGENLTVLAEEVFGNKDIPKYYKSIIDQLVGQKKSYEEIVGLIESDATPLSLNAKVYIKSVIRNTNA
ncbi:AAA family ATPase [Draconibacterium halophilum]|uniref:AAA family ATPase n=2 Tax=Draconibacterium halophilum TaxID=2706887 RepID=A0A6C0RAK9_9BACT|nr:AAA family ATPase [Draconibacterium halophilum]